MTRRHEPREEFVAQLEAHLGAELRRRRQLGHAASSPWWASWSPLKAGLAAAGVVVLSMVIGGAAVAAAYENETQEQRNLLVSSYQQRLSLAQQRLDLATQRMNDTKQRVSVGLAANYELLEMQFKVAEAETEVRSLQLQLEEVRATGREPATAVSAPLAGGRDFVAERWRLEMQTPMRALDLEQSWLRAVQQRVSVGIADPFDADIARAKIRELETVIKATQQRLDVRARFVKGDLAAPAAELRMLEVDAEQRRDALMTKIDFAHKDLARLETRMKAGQAQPVDIGEARLRLAEYEVALAKANLDLAMIRRQGEAPKAPAA